MIDISSFPTFQGQDQSSFTHPDFENNNVPQLYAHHAKHSPRHPIFAYADDEGKVHRLCYPEVYDAIRRASKIVSSEIDEPIDGVVAILATIDTITYSALLIGIMHSNRTAFPISARNSPEAVAHLLRSTDATHVYVNPDSANHRLALEVADTLKKEGRNLRILPVPHYEDLYCETISSGGSEDGEIDIHPDKLALILHSSGSTGLPKPIRYTHRGWIRIGLLPYYGDYDLCGKIIGAQALPMFHAMGAFQYVLSPCAGTVVGTFKPVYPPIFPDADVFLKSIISINSSVVYCVPSHIEAWVKEAENMKVLKDLDALIFAGAPLNDKVGTSLSHAKVPLTQMYGSTEYGSLSKWVSFPCRKHAEDWNYFELSPHIKMVKRFREDQPNLFEPIVMETPTFGARVNNVTIDGNPGFRTNDLLEVHPTRPHLYKVYGRADDQLILSTGENTNPVPMESVMLQDPNITAAVMFGHGRFQNGVLIQPATPFDVGDESLLAEFRNKIWPSVDEANRHGPTFSRVMKEMILVTKPSKPMQFTAKGTPRRQFTIESYAEEIDALYDAVTLSSQPNLDIEGTWSQASTLDLVRRLVSSVLEIELDDDDDLFQQGCDSLKATWIRNTLLESLRTSTSIPVHKIPHNFVFSHPTIRSLASFLLEKTVISDNTASSSERDGLSEKIDQMNALLEKYRNTLCPEHIPEALPLEEVGRRGRTILITGTTGCLGSHLLSQLASDPSISKIFALNRKASDSLGDRQKQAFEKWALDVSLLNSGKVALVEGNTAKESLGLTEELYREIQLSVTDVIHNAWQVDFNRALSSMEPLISGVRNLVKLSITCHARFVFVSSIAVAARQETGTVPESLVPASTAASTGYGESKWVSEQLISYARQHCSLKASIARVGQLSGDSKNGGWNAKEWAPSIVLGGKELGCLPSSDQDIYWLPVDIAASSLLEISCNRGHEDLVYHLVSPHAVKWNQIFGEFAKQLHLPLIPFPAWIQSLEFLTTSAEVYHNLNAVNLLDFYKATFNVSGSSFGARFSTENTVRISPTLKKSAPISGADISQYLAFWGLGVDNERANRKT